MNYFHYFTEIEERFQRRRGTLTILSPLDWSLMETWREAGVPLQAVLRGIDDAFDKHDARAAAGTRRLGKVNGLAWAAQSVMLATEAMKQAAVGAAAPPEPQRESGFEPAPVAAYLRGNAEAIEGVAIAKPAAAVLRTIARRLREMADSMADQTAGASEELERELTVLEERMYAALTLATPEAEMAAWREQAARGLTGSRGMSAVQLKQVTQQFLNRRMLQANQLPRLSLFYMEHR